MFESSVHHRVETEVLSRKLFWFERAYDEVRMYRIYRLIVKEFLVVFKDPKARIILILPPLIQLLVFGFAATHDVKNTSLGFYVEDDGIHSREFVSRFHAVKETFREIVNYSNAKEVQKGIDSQEVLAVIHIPPTFTRALESGDIPEVQVILDGREMNAASIVLGYIQRITEAFSQEWMQTHTSRPAFLGRENRLVVRVWFNPNLKPTWSATPPLVAILMNLVGLIVTALSVAREREMGTFEQLLVSPLRPVEILIGKAVPALLLGFFEGIAMVGLILLVFGLPFRGSLFLLFIAMILFLIATIGVGLFISSLSKTQQQGFLGAFTYMVPAVLLSGFATPVENIPVALRWMAYINPLQYMVTVVRSLFLEGPDFLKVIGMVWPLIPIGIVTLASAAILFRKRME